MPPKELDQNELLASNLFDPEWYSARNPDVKIMGMDPLQHYLWLGMRLHRSPGPKFDVQKYLQANADVARSNLNPLVHYIRYGQKEGRDSYQVPRPVTDGLSQDRALPNRHEGRIQLRPGRPTVMLCSHVAGKTLFGGERSLIDMLDGLKALDFNVIVTVPSVGNATYFETLCDKAHAVYVMRYGWWRGGEQPNERAIAGFARIMVDEQVDVVHSNTIVLREPRMAAKRMGVRSIVHVRELIRHDSHLRNQIGQTADAIISTLWDNNDRVIANSEATRSDFTIDGHTPDLVYNTVDFEELLTLPAPRSEGALRVGMISSNIPKKGIWDFARVAARVAAERPDVQFHLIGPETDHTAEIAAEIASGKLPASLKILGYRDTPAKAIAETDVLLSLSNFRESFGRTVLEAMAAKRPVVVYDHGAPPEFVRDGETGFVVGVGDIEGVANAVLRLANDRDLKVKMGARAQDEVTIKFGRDAYARQMRAVYDGLLAEPAPAQKRMVLPARGDLDPIPRDTLRIAYFCWHFPVPSETFVLNELRLLRSQGYDVRVFCRQSPYPDFKPDFEIEWERVRDHEHLAERLKETGCNAVHAHFVYPTVTDMVWPACEKAEIPFTCIAHAQDIFRYKNAMKNKISEFAQSPYCRKIFTLSRFHRRYLESRGVPGDKLVINSNCVDPDLFAGGKIEKRESRQKRQVCAVSRFAEKKGLDQLIRAGKLLERDGITINLYGYGELEETYRELIANENITNVKLHGPVKGREALLEVFRNHDLFACPSVRAQDGDMDGIPTTLMEAIAAGLPVLTTEIAGIPDLVSDNITGFVCDPNPKALADKIRSFYAMPETAVSCIMENAEARLRRNHNGPDLVENLLRVWSNETIDLMIVSWNNLIQVSEVIRRLYKFTSLPFHLVVCDNGSDRETLSHLLSVYGEHDNFTLVLNRENAFVGPGTNICLKHGRSDYAIYVCGKEGMTTNYGWEKTFVSYMNAHPDVGQAGTLCYSPSYLHGRDYPVAQQLFDKFRNPGFARDNPEREFSHVQGGFFILRRKMIDQIGGFSDEVPHSSTDVEFSYYVESCGWKLGEVPGLMALFNKTRPGLMHRIDESHAALHPPMLKDLSALDSIARREVTHCNACGRQSASFSDLSGEARCPHCNSTRRARSIHRALSESILLYRRLLALAVDVPESIEGFWREQFQGRVDAGEALDAELARAGSTNLANGRLQVVLLNGLPDDAAAAERRLTEAARLLSAGGTLFVAGVRDDPKFTDHLAQLGLVGKVAKRYASSVSHYDWHPVLVFTRAE